MQLGQDIWLTVEIASTIPRPIPSVQEWHRVNTGKELKRYPTESHVTPSQYVVSRSKVQLHPRESVVDFCALAVRRSPHSGIAVETLL